MDSISEIPNATEHRVRIKTDAYHIIRKHISGNIFYEFYGMEVQTRIREVPAAHNERDRRTVK